MYPLLNEEEQIRQTVDSCRFVQENFNEKYTYFAFPFGDMQVKAPFYNRIYPRIDLTFGISGIKNNEQEGCHLQRIDMEVNPKNAKQLINRAYLIHLIKSRFTP